MLALQQAPRAADGVWLGATTSGAPQGTFTNTVNWVNGVVAGGPDSTAVFDYNPISDGGGAGQLAGGHIFSASRTVGHFIFNDRDGFGGATIGLNNPAAAQTLTLAASNAIPSLVGGQLLNSQAGGKKVVINPIVAGTDGVRYTGVAHTSLRGGPSPLSGPLRVEGGSLEIQRPFPNLTRVEVSGANLSLGFNNASNTASTVNLLPPGAPLVLGGDFGGGTIFNSSNIASPSTSHGQTFAGIHAGAGYHWIQANTASNATTVINMSYNLGAITFAPGSALNLAKPTAGGTGVFNLANGNDPTGIVSPRLLHNGTNWAIRDGSGAAAAFTGYQANLFSNGIHTSATLSQGTGGQSETQTLRMDNAYPVEIALDLPFTLVSGGILSRQGSNRILGSTLTSALDAGDGTLDLIVHANSGANAVGLLLESAVVDNGATPLRLVKGLLGNLTLATNNAYSAGTVLGGGVTTVGVGPRGGDAGSLGTGPVVLGQISTQGSQHAPNGQLAFNRAGTYVPPNEINPTGNAGGFLAQVSPGTLVLPRAARVGGFVAQAGTTVLDFSAASAPAGQILDGSFTGYTNTLHAARLFLRQGGLQLVGAAGVTNTQSFALTDLRGASTLALKPDAAPGSGLQLELGSLVRATNTSDGYGMLMLRGVASNATVGLYSGTAGALLQDGGAAYATVNGADWGAKDATNTRVVAGGDLPGFYSPTSGGITAATRNYDYDADPNVAAVIQAASLRFHTNTAATVTLGAGAQLRLGGLLVTPATGSSAVILAGAGSLAANNTGNRDLPIFHNGAGVLTLAAPIANHSAGNVTSLVKAGPGTVELTGANTSTGRLVVHDGLVRLSGAANWGVATNRANSVHLRDGALELTGTASISASAFLSVGQIAGNNAVMSLRDTSTVNISSEFNVGDVNAGGVLNLRDTATVTARSFYVGKVGYASGTVNQSGGSLFAGNTPANDWVLGGNGVEDIAARGELNLSGGRVDAGGQNFQVGRYGLGLVNQTGGTVGGAGFAGIGRYNTGSGTWNISAGAIDFTATAAPGITATAKEYFIVAESGRGVLNLSGTGTLKARSVSIGHNGGRGTFNLSGGTVDLTATAALGGGIQPGVVFGAGAAAVPAVSLPGGAAGTLVLSGGVLRAAGITERTVSGIDSTVIFDGGVWQGVVTTTTALQGLDRALVSDDGAIVDTAGFDLTASQPLLHDGALGSTADGGLEKRGAGTLILSGAASSTFTGPTTVTAGTLQLNGTPGTDRISANVVVQTGATLARSAANQMPDTAVVTVHGTGLFSGTVADTLDSLALQSTGNNQLSGLNVTNLTRITTGVAQDVNSGTTFTTRRLVMSSSRVRLGANTGDSIMNIGPGGLELADANLQLGNAGAAFAAVVNLGGDVVSSGASAFNRANDLGARAVDLQATNRVFTVNSGTLTVAGNLRNGGLVKRGPGPLTLSGPNNTHTGDTRVESGTLALASASTNNIPLSATVWVGAGATLSVSGLAGGTLNVATNQVLTGAGTVAGAIAPEAGATVAPGENGLGTLATGAASFRAGSVFAAQINTTTGAGDRLKVTGNLGFTNGVTLALADLNPGNPALGTKYALVEYTGAWNGGVLSDGAGTPLDDGDTFTLGALTFEINYDDTTDGVASGRFVTLTVAPSTSPYASWIASFGVLPPNDGMLDDADGDGESNLIEFALNGNPTNGVANARRLAGVSTVATNGFLYTTLPVRNGAVFSGAPVLVSAPVDGFTYRFEGSENLTGWIVPVTEHTPAFTNNLPFADTGWTYRTFRFAEPLAHPRARGYLRVGAEPAP